MQTSPAAFIRLEKNMFQGCGDGVVIICLLCRHPPLSSNPQQPHKSQCGGVCLKPQSWGWGRGQQIPGALWQASPGESEFQVHWKTKNTVKNDRGRCPGSTLCSICAHMCEHTCTCVNSHTLTQIHRIWHSSWPFRSRKENAVLSITYFQPCSAASHLIIHTSSDLPFWIVSQYPKCKKPVPLPSQNKNKKSQQLHHSYNVCVSFLMSQILADRLITLNAILREALAGKQSQHSKFQPIMLVLAGIYTL